ncbi:MAG: RNA polymerase subunit sigma-24 [Candidatus Omnitrophota bacterium]|nr:MAG: RNA polymerase subunit sigma-24 [Candidatus Omnitrophota bacterium]
MNFLILEVSNNIEDREIIEKFLEGDITYFDKLVLKYKQMVFNVCLKMLGDYEEALDVSQDIFLKVYESLKNFRFEAKFSTYLYKITLNSCRSRLKALRRRKKIEYFSIDEPLETAEGKLKREFEGSRPNPKEVLEEKERQSLAIKALFSLNPEYREILILKDMEGLEYKEIAEILNINLGTVKSRLNRARNILKEKLEKIL